MRVKSRYDIDTVAKVLNLEVEETEKLLKQYCVVKDAKGLYDGMAVMELAEVMRRKRDGTCI